MMVVEKWLSNFGDRVSFDEAKTQVADTVSYVERYGSQIATLIEIRQGKVGEIVVFEIRTGKPQESHFPIKRIERIGIYFRDAESMPIVYMLREDFPDTDHQLLTDKHSPRAICIDDRIWLEARLTWTPAELFHRILSWFSRAACGELHDVHQPLDPLIEWSPYSVRLPRHALHDSQDYDFVDLIFSDGLLQLRSRCMESLGLQADQFAGLFVPVTAFVYTLVPQEMQRLLFVPKNLEELVELLLKRDIDLLGDLEKRFLAWFDEPQSSICRFNTQFAVILEMPITSPSTVSNNATDLRAFISNQSVGDVAVNLGVALAANMDNGSEMGFVKSIVPPLVDRDALQNTVLVPVEVHYEFDRKLAAEISGRRVVDDRKVAIIGAGAIGSHVVDCLAREGRFQWKIVDDDLILPHNLARHVALGQDVAKNKATFLAEHLMETLDEPALFAQAINANVMTSDSIQRKGVEQAFEEVDLIVDATASILAERYISDHAGLTRCACIFFNPAGNAAVLLVEPKDRSITLRELESQYYAFILSEQTLDGHLGTPVGTYAYTGACRAITNLIPKSHVMILSGLVARGIAQAADKDEATVKIWSLFENGSVDSHEIRATSVKKIFANEWSIVINQGLVDRICRMRAMKLPQETGGILMGVVDIPAKQIQIVDAAPAPPDSKADNTSFERGSSGVEEFLEQVSNKTQDQVRYLGEWHSHPENVSALPSQTDIAQIDWLATLFEMDNLPALMLIAADKKISVIFANSHAGCIKCGTENKVYHREVS